MPRSATRKPLDELVADFFGGEAPAAYTEETLREAAVRQAVQCHAYLRHELTMLIEGDAELGFDREWTNDTLDRIDRMAHTIDIFTQGLKPPAPPQSEPVKRHALTIEVERRAATPARLRAEPRTLADQWLEQDARNALEDTPLPGDSR